MKFQVPQFIETETKLIGPFTLRQFLWVAGGIAIIVLAYMTLPFYIFIVAALIVTIIFGSLAFLKIDNIPLINYVTYAVAYMLNPKKYIFKKDESGDIIQMNQVQQRMSSIKPPESQAQHPVESIQDQPDQNEEKAYAKEEIRNNPDFEAVQRAINKK